MWQDYVIGVAQWFFVLALIPTLLHPTEKPPFLSSVLIALFIVILGAAYASLGFLISTIPAWLQALMWARIAQQRARINRAAGIPLVDAHSFFGKRK